MAGRKKHKATWNTTEGKFIVNLEEMWLSEWHEQVTLCSESQARKYIPFQIGKDIDKEHRKYIRKKKGNNTSKFYN
jgi:hypothetical protein